MFMGLVSFDLFIVLAYSFLGASIKYIDLAFDENTFSKNKALVLAPITGIFWAYVMVLSPASATILFSIVLTVLIKGKVDNLAFRAGIISIVGVLIVSGYFEFLWIPLIFLVAAGIFDEIGNDYVDKKSSLLRKGRLSKALHYFFEYRFALKLMVLLFALLGFYSIVYFLAFLGFDIAYVLVAKYSSGLIIHKK